MNKVFIIILFIFLFLVFRFNIFETANYSGIIPPIGTNYWIASSILNANKNGFCANHCFNSRFDKVGLKSGAIKRYNLRCYEYRDNSIYSATGDWYVYRSALRIQTNFYVALDYLLSKVFNSNSNMSIFTSINTFFLCIVITLFLCWIFLEFGLITTLFVTFCLMFNHWLISFGQLPNFALFIRFLPFIFGLILIRYFENKNSIISNKLILFYIFVCVFFNQLCDYEFTPVVMVGGILPFAYYAIKNKWSAKKMLVKTGFVSIGSILAFCLAFSIHFFLVYLEFGNINDTNIFFKTKFLNRSFISSSIQIKASNNIKECSETTIFSVLHIYYNGKALIASFNLKAIIIYCFICTIFSFLATKFIIKLDSERMKFLGILSMLFVSLIGVICNFVIFKSHASCHEHIDYIFLSIPFTLLASLLMGFSTTILFRIFNINYSNFTKLVN